MDNQSPSKVCTHTDAVFENYSPVPESGCWIWLGSWSNRGYGKTGGRCGSSAVHRLFYERFKGTLSGGGIVCHKCDTPVCVNPDHLYQGTHSDNAMDRERRGRGRWRNRT